MNHSVDPFIGSEAIDLPAPAGIAATWFYIKAQIANTHPGPSLPFAPVSATAYSGGYPTGYGRYDVNTDGEPHRIYEEARAYGATHMQQSGTGFVRSFYNYLLTIPFRGPAAVPQVDLERSKPHLIVDEEATPGYYSAVFPAMDARMELTVGDHAVAHRYTFGSAGPAGASSCGALVDVSHGGLVSHKARSRAARVEIRVGHDSRQDVHNVHGVFVQQGVAWFFSIVARVADLAAEPVLWSVDSEPPGGAPVRPDGWLSVDAAERLKQIALSGTECATTRAGVLWNASQGSGIDLFVGLSVDSPDRATEYSCTAADAGFERLRAEAARRWDESLGRARIRGGDGATRKVFRTAWYHASLKPAKGEPANFIWREGPPLWTELATMWDQYKTQLPFLMTFHPEHITSLARSLLATAHSLGCIPNAVVHSSDLSSFENQSRNLGVVALYDAYRHESVRGEADIAAWLGILETMAGEVEREARAVGSGAGTQGYSHLLDVSYAAECVRKLSSELGRDDLAGRMGPIAGRWKLAFDGSTGMMNEGDYYEGGNVNYSFRLLHDMSARIEMCGGRAGFQKRLDSFFGYGAEPVRQIGSGMTQKQGIDLGRFDGLNNEVMLETPFAYHYIGAPDRASEIVHAIQTYQWSDSRGGIPGNDDSGALSSWYVWNAIGLYPVPGQDIFFISCPLFDRVDLSPCSLTIEVVRSEASDSSPAIYLESIDLNGEALHRSFLTIGEVLRGGTLQLYLSAESGRFRVSRLPVYASVDP